VVGMSVKRIIPCLDVDNGTVVKGVKFQGLVPVGDPVKLAAEYNRQGADELVFLDIGVSPRQKKTLFDVVKKVSQKVSVSLTVGGGIRCIEDVQKAISNGADKVSISTAGVVNPELIKRASEKFGSQCIVCAKDILDVLRNGKADAALISSLFHFGRYTVQDVKNYLASNGVDVR